MFTVVQQGMTLAAAAASLALASWALTNSRRAWRRHHHPVDLAVSVASGVWLLQVLAATALVFAADQPAIHGLLVPMAHTGYQALLVSIAFFLLTSAGVASAGIYLLLLLQALAGAAALYWHYWPDGETAAPAETQAQARQAWITVNLLAVTLLTTAIACRVYLARSYAGWLALAASIMGLGLCVDDLLLPEPSGRIVTLSHYLYAAFLLVVWHLVRQRGGRLDPRSALPSGFQRSTGFEPLTGFGPAHDAAASAVAVERRRIAQDLHDGVGSQIVSILSSLDCQAPQQQAVALALEQCLVDLKMTVDAIDCANDNVLEALGRLRYRVQHSLDKLGIRMSWKVQVCDELEAVRGVQAQQVLRIAQECLANVMRHAQATDVEVVCRYVPETDQMVLEVRDNGRGITRGKNGRPAGKGLENMRRRAQLAGGDLLISSKATAGTRVKLTLPLIYQADLPHSLEG